MAPLRHVLIAIDLSGRSAAVLDRGMRIAHRHRIRCTVLHALGFDARAAAQQWAGGAGGQTLRRLRERAHEILEGEVSTRARRLKIDARVLIEDGLATEAIPAQAHALGVDLVVLGAHGSGFVQRLLFGATASAVLRRSVVPVLIIKRARRGDYRHVAVGVDFSAASATALGTVQTVAPDAHFTLLHAIDLPYENQLLHAGVDDSEVRRYRSQAEYKALGDLHDLARRFELGADRCTARVMHGDATKAVLSHEDGAPCDLVALGNHGMHVTEALLLGSVTSHVVARSRADVLVVRDAPRGAASG